MSKVLTSESDPLLLLFVHIDDVVWHLSKKSQDFEKIIGNGLKLIWFFYNISKISQNYFLLLKIQS